ncbi:MAG: M3 family oligoendopeptidase, partial [Anaerolineaceae bacterium]|nr:M3 family oligoendopeptidase [Anaerolineaceae bacterium]
MKIKPPYVQTRWSLEDLIPGGAGPALDLALKKLDDKVAAFEAVRPQLREDITFDEFLHIVRQIEEITYDGNQINSFAGLWFSEDTQNQSAQTLLARIDQIVAELSNKILFFSLWWKEVSLETANRLMEKSGDYRYWLEEMRHF